MGSKCIGMWGRDFSITQTRQPYVSSWVSKGFSINDRCRYHSPTKGDQIGDYRIELVVEDTVVVEIKSVERHDPLFEAQVLTYLKITGKKIGLLMNFNSRLLTNGIKRLIF